MPLRQPPIKTLPDDYHEVHYLSVTEVDRLARLNIWAFGLLAAFIILMIAWMVALLVLRGSNDASFHIPVILRIIGVLLALPLHELIHGLAIQLVGHRPTYGVKYADLGRFRLPLVLYATSGDALFRRREFIMIALAPVVIGTLGGMTLMVFLPDHLAYYVALAVILNGSGSVGDLWMTAVVLHYPANVLVRDEADSIRIYAR